MQAKVLRKRDLCYDRPEKTGKVPLWEEQSSVLVGVETGGKRTRGHGQLCGDFAGKGGIKD